MRALVLASVCWGGTGAAQLRAEAVVARIDGEPLELREFKARLGAVAAECFAYFHTTYQAEDDEGFWTRDLHGEIPIERARAMALEAAVRIKVQLILGRRLGLWEDVSYADFLERWQRENRRRREMVASGGIIYGPREYKEADYFTYLVSNRVIQLKAKLAEKELAVSEDELRACYERDREARFRQSDSVAADRVTLCRRAGGAWVDAGDDEDAREKIAAIAKKLEEGSDVEHLADTGGADWKVEVSRLRFAPNSDDAERFPRSHAEAKKLSVGASSGVFEENGGLAVLEVVEKNRGGYLELSEIAGSLRAEMVDEKYEALVDKLARQAEVVMFPEVLNATRVR